MADGVRVSVVAPTLVEKPWGGRRLTDLGITLPTDRPYGEALIAANATMVTAGEGEGRSLGEIASADPATALGRIGSGLVGGRPLFPLLIKLIDARENLSIQVHPDDDGAAAHDQPGKTEAWHALAADPGAALYLGLRPGIEAAAFLETAQRMDGSSATLLRRVPARVGTTVLLPAGTVHALGAGVMVYEVQQPSDITYRLDDWGRVDAHGTPRELHAEAGAAALREQLRPEIIAPVEVRFREGRRHLLAVCRFFALERIALPSGGRLALPCTDAGPQVITVLAGTADLSGHGLATGGSGVVWPGSEAMLAASSPVTALRAWVPDLPADLDVMPVRGEDRHRLGDLGEPSAIPAATSRPERRDQGGDIAEGPVRGRAAGPRRG